MAAKSSSDGGSTATQSQALVLPRLSCMMLMQYGTLGLWSVTVNTFIGSNTGDAGSGMFSPGFIGLAATTGALGGLLAPAVLGVIADRYFSTQKLLAILHAACVLCLIAMCGARNQIVFYLALLTYYQAYVPTITLSNSLALRHLPDVDRQFPVIRAVGTAGWVAAGVLVGFVWQEVVGHSIEATLVPLKIAAVVHAALALYCLTLPATPALGQAQVGWRALAGGTNLWRNRQFLIFIAVSVIAVAPSQFYNSFVNPFMNHTGFEHAAAKLTLGQLTEIGCMLALPLLLVRFGLRRLFLVGSLAWAIRFWLLASYESLGLWVTYPAILVHGACFTFVYMTGQLYADRLADRDARAAAQGVHMLATSGLGHLVGAFAAQFAQARLLTPEGVSPPPYDWHKLWLIPLAISLGATLLFALFFREPATDSTSPERPAKAEG